MLRIPVRNSDGFAMVAVLLALLILIGLGALIFTMSTRDIRVSTRTVGEKKAYSAAQTAIAQAILNTAPGATSGGNPNNPSTWPQVDPANDPNTVYYYSVSASASSCAAVPLFDLNKWSQDIYVVDARGANTRYQSQVLLDASLGVFRSGTCAKSTE